MSIRYHEVLAGGKVQLVMGLRISYEQRVQSSHGPQVLYKPSEKGSVNSDGGTTCCFPIMLVDHSSFDERNLSSTSELLVN